MHDNQPIGGGSIVGTCSRSNMMVLGLLLSASISSYYLVIFVVVTSRKRNQKRTTFVLGNF